MRWRFAVRDDEVPADGANSRHVRRPHSKRSIMGPLNTSMSVLGIVCRRLTYLAGCCTR